MTIAEKIEKQFGNDGQKFEDVDGNSIVEICESFPHVHVQDQENRRYIFSDSSVITIQSGYCWDLGYEQCWCMQTCGHTNQCLGIED